MTIFEMSDDELLEAVTPMAEKVQLAFDENNYQKLTEHWSSNFIERYPREQLHSEQQDFISQFGTLEKMEFVLIHRNPDNIIVQWKKYCTESKMTILILYVFVGKDDLIQINTINSFWNANSSPENKTQDQSIFNMCDDKVLEIVTPMAKSMEQAWDDNDYDTFVSGWSDETRKKFAKEEFDRQRNILFPRLGAYTTLKFLNIHRGPAEIIVQWEIKYLKRQEPLLLIYRLGQKEGKIIFTDCILYE